MLFIYLLKDKRFLQRHIGNISQVAGLKRCGFTEGTARRTGTVGVQTGSNLNFTGLPGRSIDTAWEERIGEAVYVMNMRPGNYNSISKGQTKKKDEIEKLKAAGKKKIQLETGVLSTHEKINVFIKTVEILQ